MNPRMFEFAFNYPRQSLPSGHKCGKSMSYNMIISFCSRRSFYMADRKYITNNHTPLRTNTIYFLKTLLQIKTAEISKSFKKSQLILNKFYTWTDHTNCQLSTPLLNFCTPHVLSSTPLGLGCMEEGTKRTGGIFWVSFSTPIFEDINAELIILKQWNTAINRNRQFPKIILKQHC